MVVAVTRSFERTELEAGTRPRRRPVAACLSLMLLLAMVLSTVWALDQARWVEGTGVLFPMALVGTATGLLLARTRLPAWVGLALGLVTGIAVAFVVVGQVLPPLLEVPGRLGQTLADTLVWIGRPESPAPLLVAARQSAASAAEFGQRVVGWMQLGMTGRTSSDNAVFLLLIAYVAWLQGFVGAWGLFRLRDVVVAALPTGVVLATNVAYTGRAQAPFAVFIITIITLLLLAVSLNLAALEQRWERSSVEYPAGLLLDVTVGSFVVVGLLVVVALFGPRVGENPLSNAFWGAAGEQWSEVENASTRLFSGVNSPAASTGGSAPDRLVVGAPARTGQRVVMRVQSEEPYYWRGATYDTYTGYDWLSSDKVPVSRSGKQLVLPGRFRTRKRVKLTFEVVQNRSDLIYAPDEPVQLSIPYRLMIRSDALSVADYASLRAKKPAAPTLKYTVEAMTSVASADELRRAPADLPEWMLGARLTKDTVLIGPGERYDLEFVARAPGQWLVHCHINHHVTNNGAEEQGAGGLTMILEVAPGR